MKKIIIGSLVGGLILFIWGFLSWVVLPVHFQSFHYTPAQDSIMKSLADANLESGTYFIPYIDNREGGFYDPKFQAEMKKHHDTMMGKPMATINYIKAGMHDDPMTMGMGFILNLFSAFCAALLLAAASAKTNSFFSRWWLVMLIAVILCTSGPLLDWNWMGMPWHYIKGIIFDNMIGWGLCGVWLAWYFGRE